MSRTPKPGRGGTWREGQVREPAPTPVNPREQRNKAQHPAQPAEAGGAPDSTVDPLREMDAAIVCLAASMNPRHTKFARLLAEGSNQEAAAVACGYTPGQSARSQGSRLAAAEDVSQLVDLIVAHDVLTCVYVRRPAIRAVLIEVMRTAPAPGDRVKACVAAMKLEGYERVQVEVTAGSSAKDPEEMRRHLAETLARARAQLERDGGGRTG